VERLVHGHALGVVEIGEAVLDHERLAVVEDHGDVDFGVLVAGGRLHLDLVGGLDRDRDRVAFAELHRHAAAAGLEPVAANDHLFAAGVGPVVRLDLGHLELVGAGGQRHRSQEPHRNAHRNGLLLPAETVARRRETSKLTGAAAWRTMPPWRAATPSMSAAPPSRSPTKSSAAT